MGLIARAVRESPQRDVHLLLFVDPIFLIVIHYTSFQGDP